MAQKPVTEVRLDYRPRTFFLPFHRRKTRFALILAHRGAGKTEACIQELVWRALKTKKPRAKYAYIGPYASQVYATVWDRLKNSLPYELYQKCKVRESGHNIELPNGASIHLFGADKYDNLRGHRFDGIILDEVADLHPDAWPLAILPALSQQIGKDGWAVFIGTPKGRGNFFHDQYEKARKNEFGDWTLLELPWWATNVLSEQGLAQARREMDDEEFKQEYECSFDAAVKGTFYTKQLTEAAEQGRICLFEHVKNAPVHLAFDLGWSDATACWFFQVINGRLDVLDYYEVNGLAIPDIVREVREKAKERGYKLGIWWMPHDAGNTSLQTGKSIIEQLWGLGITPQKVPDIGVQHGIQAVRHTLPACRFHERNTYQGLEALRAYRKRENKQNATYSREPVHDWASHGADAFRYLAVAVRDEELQASLPQRAAGAGQQDSLDALSLNSPDELVEAGLSREEADWLLQMTNNRENAYARI